MAENNLCPQCESPLTADAHFCSNCGWSMSEQPRPAPPAKGSSKNWVWVLGMLGLFIVCLILMVVIYFAARQFGMDIPNPFASKTPTATLTSIPTNTSTLISRPTLSSRPTKTLTEPLGVGSWRMRGIDIMVEMYIPAGEFIMGSSSGDADETPVHSVWLNGYWIDKTEVTNLQYGMCVTAGACSLPQQTDSLTRSNYFHNNFYQDYPVIYVTWNDAHDYCDWVGGYLPTEAEWEKAARGMNGNKFPWGNSNPTTNLANFNYNLGDTSMVASYPDGASPYGVLDMAGNVYEWVYDYYSDDYYSSSPVKNPFGPSNGDMHVLKGASFNTPAYKIRSSYRAKFTPTTTGNDDGFRCIRYKMD